MRRLFRLTFCLLSASLLLYGCKGLRNGGLVYGGDFVVQLGYEADSEALENEFEHSDHLSETVFVPFADQASIDEAEKIGQDSEVFGKAQNNYEYRDDVSILLVKTYPEIAGVESFSIVSSDSSILEILRTEDNQVFIRTRKLGEVRLTLTVKSALQTVTNEYPIRVYTKVNMNFYITPYWLKDVFNTRIRYKVKNMPPGEKDLVTEVKDSVSVVGYCESYDFEKSRDPRIRRDTLRFALQDRVDRFRKNHRLTVRNITEAFLYFGNKAVRGTKYEFNPVTFQYDLVPYEYPYKVEQVIVDFNVVCTNPYVEFVFNSKYDKTFDHYDEKTGTVFDTGSDDPEDDGGVDNEPELTKSEVRYFQVLLNSFMKKDERDQMMKDLQNFLDQTGYNPSMSDEDKDKALDEINKHKKKD